MRKAGRDVVPTDNNGKLLLSSDSIIRFWSSVDTQTPSKLGCWFWRGWIKESGYGEISIGNKVRRAHRLSYMMHRGPIPDDMCVCHACDVRHCVRPDHLWLGTREDNQKDMAKKGRAAKGDANGTRKYPERIRRGTGCWNAKLDDERVLLLRKLYTETGLSVQALSDKFGVGIGVTWRIIKRKSWKHLP